METRNKLWLGLGVVCAAGTAAYVTATDDPNPAMDSAMEASATEGGEGGEGASEADSVANDDVYLGQLAFIRGHLNVGVDLYRQGQIEASATHMKHPEDEIYANLQPALESREAPEFADQLSALASAVENRSPVEEVEAAYQELLAAIEEAESTVEDQDAEMTGHIIVNLVRTAAAEYDIAVGNGGIVENEHEYQDSLGFVRIAREMLDHLPRDAENAEALEEISDQLDLITPIWPGLQAPERLNTDPSVIYGAAGRIEFAVAKL